MKPALEKAANLKIRPVRFFSINFRLLDKQNSFFKIAAFPDRGIYREKAAFVSKAPDYTELRYFLADSAMVL
jgi:hypothetical protein